MSLLSALLGFLATLVNKWLATKRAEQALRDLGAEVQKNESRVEAERQESAAIAAADQVPTSNEVDESDPFLRKD